MGTGPDQANRQGSPSIQTAAANWPTPRVAAGGYTRDNGNPDLPRPTLEGKAQMWQTPAADSFRSRGGDRKDEMGLDQQARLAWPTPSAAQDTKGAQATAEAAIEREGRGKQLALADRALIFSRPDLPIGTPGRMSWPARVRALRRLLRWMTSRYGRSVVRRLMKTRHTRRLNPLFVEWLMGWPTGHALCACSATGFARWQQDMRGALSALPTACGPWIWEPPAETTKAVQGGLFDAL